jgi:hypothetical protein
VPSSQWAIDDGDLVEMDLDDATLAMAQGETAQEVLKLQEELSVIRAANESAGHRRRRAGSSFGGIADGVDFSSSADDAPRAGGETTAPTAVAMDTSSGSGGADEFDDDDDETASRAPLPDPARKKLSAAALLGPGAPAELVSEAISFEVGDAIAGGGAGAGVSEDEDAVSVGVDEIARRIATGKGGSNFNAPSSPDRGVNARAGARGGKDPRDAAKEREDECAFKTKLYPAGTILHMVLADPPRDDDDAAAAAAAGDVEDAVPPPSPGGSRAPEPEPAITTRAAKYKMYADVDVAAYDRITLSKTMLSDHFLPKYLDALDDVIEHLGRGDGGEGRTREARSS